MTTNAAEHRRDGQPGHRREAEDEVEQDGADRADRHRLLAAHAVGEQAVDELADGIPAVAAGADHAVLRVVELELFLQLRRDDAEVVAAEVVAGVEQAEGEPVASAAAGESRADAAGSRASAGIGNRRGGSAAVGVERRGGTAGGAAFCPPGAFVSDSANPASFDHYTARFDLRHARFAESRRRPQNTRTPQGGKETPSPSDR